MSVQKNFRHAALLLQFLLLFSIAASGQNVSPNLYSGMRWRMIGPFRGGRALTATGVRGQRDVYYFGAVGGGVWKTSNSGQTWTPIFDSQPIASIGSLAVAPSDGNILYVGTGEASIRSDISFGNGVYKSTDAGKTWTHVGLEDTRHIGRVLIDPKDANVVFVAALGHAYGPNQERGVFRTTDGGRTWQKVLYKDANTGAIDLAYDPDDSKIIYATLWNAHRPPWSTYPPIQGPGSGLYKSTDGGTTWTQIKGNGLPSADWGRAGIATSKNVVYLLVDTLRANQGGLFTGDEGGLYRSDDRGATWRRVSNDRRTFGRQWYFGEITVDSNNPEVVYIPNVAIYKSADGGKTFAVLKGQPGGDDYHFVWLDPDDPLRMVVASDQGTIVSADGGKSWSSWYNQPTAQFYHVATDNQFPYYVYGGQQDSGTAATTSRSDYGSITFRDWYSVGGGEAGAIAPDPSDPNTVYAGDTYGRLYRFDKVTGQSLNISPTPVAQFGQEISRRKLRFTWTSPIVFSPQDPKTLYMGAQYVLRSQDRGNSWQQISPDLTGCVSQEAPDRGRPGSTAEPVTTQNAASKCYGVVYAIAPSAVDGNVIWAGSDTGKIWITRDGGKAWADLTSSSFQPFSKISMIDASHFDAGTAYVAVDRHRIDDYTPAIYGTHDFGKSWKRMNSGIAAAAFVRAVREDPRRKGLLYAATEVGVYVSFDDGEHWQPLQLNLPVTPVHDLVIHEDDLVIATHGRSFWILDDVTPLRQITREVANSPAYLYAPQTAMRVRSDVGHDTPLPPEEPAGQNPPAGAIVDYYLAQPAKEVMLEILDSSDKQVRRFSSADKPFEPEKMVPIASGWFMAPTPVETAVGEHRFVWDLRYPDPPSLHKNYDISAVWGVGVTGLPVGPLVLPGNYQVRLTVDGRSFTQALTVKLDPRLKATRAELQKQFELEMQITDAMRQAYTAMQQRGEKPAITTPGENRPPRGDTLAGTLNNLSQLLEVVDTADAAPTRQAEEAWQELRAKLAEQLH
ncbi:MAG: WD40/YVTN/BNR-like repeat-containing protein [Terriglobales bacterium]